MSHRILVLIAAAGFAVRLHAATPTLEEGYRQMYNLQFTEAHQTFQEFQQLNPRDPMGPASDAAAYLFSEFDRLHILQSEFFVQEQHFYTDRKLSPDPLVKKKFDAALNAALALAGPAPSDSNAMFASLLASGLRSDYTALIEKRYRAAFSDMKAARQKAEKLLAKDPQFYDAWIAVGVENYMLSIKAAPIRFLLWLAGGEMDRNLGIQKLKLTAEKGHYLGPFARLLLAVVALRDGNKAQARTILDALSKEYPHNSLYVQELARLQPPPAGGLAR